jgi:hypothetical protein
MRGTVAVSLARARASADHCLIFTPVGCVIVSLTASVCAGAVASGGGTARLRNSAFGALAKDSV